MIVLKSTLLKTVNPNSYESLFFLNINCHQLKEEEKSLEINPLYIPFRKSKKSFFS